MDNLEQTPKAVPAIEQALNFIMGPTKRGDNVRQHVEKGCRVIAGSKQRKMLQQAVMASFIEAGLKGSQPADRIAAVVEAKAVQEAPNADPVH